MKAHEIQPGDQLPGNYTVEEVKRSDDGDVMARVRYADGGDGIRIFDADQEVPLARGATK